MKSNTIDIFNDLQKLFAIKGINPDNVFVAGGAILGQEAPNDIDLYCLDIDTINRVDEVLTIISKTRSETEMSNTYICNDYSCPVQVIKILTGQPEEVIKQFDFEQNACYVKFSSRTFLLR